jgi:hypothetical protein
MQTKEIIKTAIFFNFLFNETNVYDHREHIAQYDSDSRIVKQPHRFVVLHSS